jgi:hypothetical protein
MLYVYVTVHMKGKFAIVPKDHAPEFTGGGGILFHVV